MISAVTAVVGNYNFGLTETGHLLNSTTTYDCIFKKSIYMKIFWNAMHTWLVCGKIYMNPVANVDIFFITLIATGIHSRLGKNKQAES